MSDKDFLLWWDKEGSGMPPMQGEDAETHVRRICEIAWANGAYKSSAPKWQPIETAPYDEDILAWNDHGDILIGRFTDGYFESHGKIYFMQMWMPLPTPPKEK